MSKSYRPSRAPRCATRAMVELFLLRAAGGSVGDGHSGGPASEGLAGRAGRRAEAAPDDGIVIDLVAIEREAGRTDR